MNKDLEILNKLIDNYQNEIDNRESKVVTNEGSSYNKLLNNLERIAVELTINYSKKMMV